MATTYTTRRSPRRRSSMSDSTITTPAKATIDDECPDGNEREW